MASSKTATNTKALDRNRKGTTTRRGSTLRAALLLLIPIIALVTALARGVEERRGPVPDWRPAPVDQH
jgi:hypothetical protein